MLRILAAELTYMLMEKGRFKHSNINKIIPGTCAFVQFLGVYESLPLPNACKGFYAIQHNTSSVSSSNV